MRGFTTSSNHSSSTWCRKTFESIGEITPPCGVPLVPKCRSLFSSTPALSHLSIMRRITPSVTRWSRDVVKPRMTGPCTLVRFADDFVMTFKSYHDAKRVLEVHHGELHVGVPAI